MLNIASSIFNTPSCAPLLNSLEGGVSPILITGLASVHRAALICALRGATGRNIFALCPDETAAASMTQDIFCLSGLTPGILTSRELCLIRAQGVSRFEEQKRIAALCSLQDGTAGITLCTVSGMTQRTLAPEIFSAAKFTLSLGQTIPPEDLENRLLAAGYTRSQQVEGAGQFSRRGGIIDIFSPAELSPIRAEFWGDEINSMGFFDAATQRRDETVDIAVILPARETLPNMYDTAALHEKILARAKSAAKKSELLRLTLTEDAELLKETGSLPWADRYISLLDEKLHTALDYLPGDTLIIICEPKKCRERADEYEKLIRRENAALIEDGVLDGALAEYTAQFSACCSEFEDYPTVMADAFTLAKYPVEPRGVVSLSMRQLPAYAGNAETAVEDVKRYTSSGYGALLLAYDERRAKLLCSRLTDSQIPAAVSLAPPGLPEPGRCLITIGALSAGIEVPEIKLCVLTDTQLSGAGQKRRIRHTPPKNRQAISSYDDLSVGDLVVHEYHGIGRFMGFVKIPLDGVERDYIKISYAGKDVLNVPATKLDLVSKYLGGGEDAPVRLSKMGGADWSRTRTKAKAAAKEMAKELIALYANRHGARGHSFPPDGEWQSEFEQAFGYVETDDQLRCADEIKKDMQSASPMDRLLCGDVGYGKTEVALRAVMKCVLDGKQAAILVPTTVLAQQHYQTAQSRFFGYPVRIEVLSRFRSPAQIKQTLCDLKDGAADIVIGTHRLLQKDVKFKDLGLLVVDEEQRFGVSHKERLKEMSVGVDALTLSATPIPRTLNMALSSIRDMSTIEEPPQSRLPVQTYVLEHDWGVIREAILKEVTRGGQVYYLHNRVENIERTAIKIADMLENVSVACAHGRMGEDELMSVMDGVTSGETQVLVCTTIIETGIDIPNVNTLIIEDADKLGLAQLHQIRGRVGRSARRAYAYLTFRKDKALTEIAEKRLFAIREFAEFNSGIKIAMRDLEIRGAGNLLGAEQSGHMIDVGFDMYMKLLREAVSEERGEKPELRAECAADLAVAASIPEKYIQSERQRMDFYRRIALIRTEDDADDLTDELIDRFGDPPSNVNTLIQVALLRGEASRAGILDISQKAGVLRLKLAEFNMERVSRVYAMEEYKGRFRVEAGQSPTVTLKLKAQKHVLDEARALVAAYGQITDNR